MARAGHRAPTTAATATASAGLAARREEDEACGGQQPGEEPRERGAPRGGSVGFAIGEHGSLPWYRIRRGGQAPSLRRTPDGLIGAGGSAFGMHHRCSLHESPGDGRSRLYFVGADVGRWSAGPWVAVEVEFDGRVRICGVDGHGLGLDAVILAEAVDEERIRVDVVAGVCQ